MDGLQSRVIKLLPLWCSILYLFEDHPDFHRATLLM